MNKGEYFQRVRKEYFVRSENILPTNGTYPTKANIKNECLKLLEDVNGLASNDRIIIRRYFDLKENELLTKKKVSLYLDSFNTIIRFLKAESDVNKIEAVDLLALLIDCKPRPYDYEKLEALNTNSILKYDSLKQRLTANFVGRNFVFKRINNFIQERESGYFTVKGNAGIGKSTLALKYATDNNTLLHVIGFNRNSKNTVAKFIANITSQLKEKYQLTYNDLPKNYDKDGGYLEETLLEASKTLPKKEKLVIVVDGLDELSDLTKFRKENILHLPEVLPKGIFFLMTMRDIEDDVRMPNNEGSNEIYSLAHDGEENKADIKEYIKQISKNEGIQEYLKKHSKKERDFIKEIEKKADGNFMYLFHVLKEIEDGIYKDTKLNDLPQGLEGYYKDHWERMMDVSDEMKEVKLKVIYVLGVLEIPTSAKLLTDIIKQDLESVKQFQVQEIINQWRQFFNEGEEVFDNIATKTYSIYHKSFLDFLKKMELVNAVGFSFEEADELKGKFLDFLEGDLFDGINLDEY